MKASKIMFLIISIMIGIYALSGNLTSAAGMEKYFSKSGAKFVKSDVEGHAYIKCKDDLEKILVNLFESMEYNGEYSVFDNGDFLELKSADKDTEIIIRGKAIKDKNMNYVSITLSQGNMDRNINSIRRTISKAFSLYDTKPSFSSLIQGKFDGKMSVLDMNKMAREVFTENGASSIKGVESEKLVSVSGFMPAFKERVKADNRYVNLNVALRYSEVNSCTYIWIGSPIISVEY